MEIGIDLGGTKIAGGLFKNGKIIKRFQLPTNAGSSKRMVIAQIKAVISELSKNQKISGVGIGVPGLFKGAKIILLPNIKPLDGVDIKRELKLSCKVVLENDSKCFALAESMHGAGKNKKNVIGVIIGTGVGGGIIAGGKLCRGAHNFAGEIGHIINDTSLESFSPLNKKGDWESLISGPGIVRRHNARGGIEDHPAKIWISNTPESIATREETIRLLCIFFSSLQSIFDPDIIVVGGGVSNLPFYSEVNKRLLKYDARPIVKKSKHGVDASIIGAVIALKNHE